MATAQKTICNERYSLNWTGNPVWTLNGEKLKPDSYESFEKIILQFQNKKSDFLDHLRGHFSIILHDNEKNITIAATDRIGAHRLYWSKTANHKTIISPSLEEVRSQLKSTPELSSEAIYSYMYFHMIPTPYSIYSGIKKLPPGHCLWCEKNEVRTETYWSPKFSESTNASIDELSEKLHKILRTSVSSSIPENRTSAGFLSGGLDSSTVIGVMSAVCQQPAQSYSIGFNAKEYDETPFARLTSNHFKTEHHEYYVTPNDITEAVSNIAATYHEPFGNSSALPTYYCAKFAAENGVKTMLAGDGGDEIFAGNSRYASQRYYRYYQALPKPLRSNLLDPLINSIPPAFPLATKAKNYIKQANIPLPDRLQIYNFLHRHDPMEMFNSDFLQSVDTQIPLQLQRKQFDRAENATELNRMLYLDWQFTLADNDLRKVSSMCELAGVDVEYPLLTDELLEFSCTVPSEMKLKQGKLRYFYKYAMRNFLAKETLAKSKHGFGLPFGVWLKDYQPLRELAQDSLSKLKTRSYFNPAFIDKALEMHEGTHASYYGELIWVMMMLELWLDSHQSSYKN